MIKLNAYWSLSNATVDVTFDIDRDLQLGDHPPPYTSTVSYQLGDETGSTMVFNETFQLIQTSPPNGSRWKKMYTLNPLCLTMGGIMYVSVNDSANQWSINDYQSVIEFPVPKQFTSSDLNNAVSSATSVLSGMLATRTAERDALQTQLNTQSGTVSTLQNQVATLTAQITTLQNQVVTLTTQRDTLQNQLNTTNAQLTTTTQQKEAAEAQVTILNGQISTLQNQITPLQTQLANALAALSAAVPLEALEASGEILKPKRRTGEWTIKDFNVLNTIYREAGLYKSRDVDFINIQLLSLRQGARKMREIADAYANDPNMTTVFRKNWLRTDEWRASVNADFREYLLETSRMLDYVINEVRNNQKFNLLNPQFVRVVQGNQP